ncbi:MAG: GyrI-like domain-containing protein [Gemmatimonadota bacterium]
MTAIDILEHAEVDVPSVPGVRFETTCATDPAAIAAAMQRGFARLMPYIARNNLLPAGPPRAIYSTFTDQETHFALAMPVANTAGAIPEDGITLGTLPGGRMHRFTHHGPYPELGRTYDAITAWMQDAGLMTGPNDWSKCSPMWEEYINDPMRTAAADLITYIYVPVPA